MKNIKTIFLFVIIGIWSCESKVFPEEKLVTPAQAVTLLVQDIQCVDIRSSDLYGQYHLDQAINIPYTSSSFKQELNGLDKKKSILVYDKDSTIPEEALNTLKELGFSKIYILLGGAESWMYQGLDKPKNK